MEFPDKFNTEEDFLQFSRYYALARVDEPGFKHLVIKQRFKSSRM